MRAAESLPAVPLRRSGARNVQAQHCVCMTACFVQRKPPAGAARGGEGEHGNEQRSAAQCEPRAASRSGVGAGEVKPEAAGRPADREVGRMRARPLKKNVVFAKDGLRRWKQKAKPCAPHPARPVSGGARHNVNYTLRTARRGL